MINIEIFLQLEKAKEARKDEMNCLSEENSELNAQLLQNMTQFEKVSICNLLFTSLNTRPENQPVMSL